MERKRAITQPASPSPPLFPLLRLPLLCREVCARPASGRAPLTLQTLYAPSLTHACARAPAVPARFAPQCSCLHKGSYRDSCFAAPAAVAASSAAAAARPLSDAAHSARRSIVRRKSQRATRHHTHLRGDDGIVRLASQRMLTIRSSQASSAPLAFTPTPLPHVV